MCRQFAHVQKVAFVELLSVLANIRMPAAYKRVWKWKEGNDLVEPLNHAPR